VTDDKSEHRDEEGGAGTEDAWASPAKTLRLKTRKNFAELLAAFPQHTSAAQLRHELMGSLQPRVTRDQYIATRKTRPSSQLPESAVTIPELTADPTFHSPQPSATKPSKSTTRPSFTLTSHTLSRNDDHNTNHKFQDGSEKVSRPSLNEYFLSDIRDCTHVALPHDNWHSIADRHHRKQIALRS